MADLTHNEIMKLLRTDRDLRSRTYNAAASAGYFAESVASDSEYQAVIRTLVTPAAPVAAAPAAPAARAAPPAAPAAPAAPVAPPAPLTPADMYNALPVDRKQYVLAELAMNIHDKRDSANTWFNGGIAGIVIGLTLEAVNLFVPWSGYDEAGVRRDMQKQQSYISDYQRTHSGRSPPESQLLSSEQIRDDNSSDRSPWKYSLIFGGLAALALGGLGFEAGRRKRKNI